MKELTTEEKAKRYDKALSKARDLYLPSDSALLEEIFPELIESNDEKIREEIINYFECQSRDEPTRKDIHNKWIVWLEKQSQTFTKQEVDDAYLAGVRDTKSEIQKQYEASYQIRKDIATFIFNYRGDIKDRAKWMNYLGIKISFVENKSKSAVEAIKEEKVDDANKVEPKFKVGDWVIDKQRIVHQIANVIENVTYHTYGYDIVGGGYFNDNTEGVRLWTIQDAEEGNVLAEDSCIFIVQKLGDNSTAKVYCVLFNDGDFYANGTLQFDMDSTRPATKEQYNTLMKAMADAGWEFDFDKKELKNIEL